MFLARDFFLRLFFATLTVLTLSSCTKETVNTYTKEMEQPAPNPPTTTIFKVPTPPPQKPEYVQGSGAKAVLCEKSDKSTAVELLDFYEARVLYGLEFSENFKSLDEAKEKLAQLLAKHFLSPEYSTNLEEEIKFYRQEINYFFEHRIRFIQSDKKLKLTEDILPPVNDSNCQLVQASLYHQESLVLVDKNLWDKMSFSNKVGLIANEMLHLSARKLGSTNSAMSRRLVGQLFSKSGAVPVADGVMNGNESKKLVCTLSQQNSADLMNISYGYVFESKLKNNLGTDVEGVELVFEHLNFQPVFFKTTLFFRSKKLNDFLPECIGNTSLCKSRSRQSARLNVAGYHNSKITAVLSIGPDDTIKPPISIPTPGEPKPPSDPVVKKAILTFKHNDLKEAPLTYELSCAPLESEKATFPLK